MHPTIRRARPQDAPDLARVHVASWRETYAGMLPDGILAGLSVEARSAMWTQILTDAASTPSSMVFVCERESRIVGFGACGPQRSDTLKAQGFDVEIGALYIVAAAQRQGVGRQIMNALASGLMEAGRRSVSLWVLRDNSVARRFYERLGGEVVGEKVEMWPGASLVEIAYGWRDLRFIAGQSATPAGK